MPDKTIIPQAEYLGTINVQAHLFRSECPKCGHENFHSRTNKLSKMPATTVSCHNTECPFGYNVEWPIQE